MGFIYRLHPVRAQSQIPCTGGSTLCDALPLPSPFVGARHGVPDDDDNGDALLGSRLYHRTAAGILAQSQSARHPFPLPLGAHSLFQSVCVQDTRRPAAGKRHRTRHLSVFKNYVAQNLHKETKPGARLMNWFLILICIIIGVFLSIILFQEVGK